MASNPLPQKYPSLVRLLVKRLQDRWHRLFHQAELDGQCGIASRRRVGGSLRQGNGIDNLSCASADEDQAYLKAKPATRNASFGDPPDAPPSAIRLI